MIFSVFNTNAREWRYFEAPGNSANYGARGTKYRPLNGRPSGPPRGLGGVVGIGPIGFTAEALAMPLPRNARPIGRGTEARGIIAVVPTTDIRPAYPSQYEEWQGALRGLGGLGADEPAPPLPPPPVGITVLDTPLNKVVFAACIASVVGVLVQRALK